jgi:hypothetical protein
VLELLPNLVLAGSKCADMTTYNRYPLLNVVLSKEHTFIVEPPMALLYRPFSARLSLRIAFVT